MFCSSKQWNNSRYDPAFQWGRDGQWSSSLDFISTMLILFEGARGKWIIMLPSSLGLISMTFGVWNYWNDESMAGPLPKYMSIIVTLIYIGGYVSLRSEGVNEGLSDFKPGLKVKDKIAMISLILLVLAGLFYSIE